MMKFATIFLLGGCVDAAPATWTYTYATIVAPNCTTSSCHSTVAQTEGVDLGTAASAYRTFAGVDCGQPVVESPDPNENYVFGLMREESGEGMPPLGLLPDRELDQVAAWIARGMPCD